MAAKPPPKDFGKRRPAAIASAPRQPVKRSGHVALLVMGTIAVGASAYTLMPRRSCDPLPAGTTPPGVTAPGTAAAAPTRTDCSSSGHGSSGSSHWSSRSGFYSSDSSTHSSSGGPSDAGSGGVTRGGFGSFAHAFSGGS
ncbi:hypothetical protein [Bradyrhizobium sp. Gha]|uniref:hypothetical protein n=1 Tax=Bradyrhizobium sp. Gha TaxID=1855318 RepID=UPI000A93AACA|nr:hypothetical protein [Bradyrhizobium sp. Gha]